MDEVVQIKKEIDVLRAQQNRLQHVLTDLESMIAKLDHKIERLEDVPDSRSAPYAPMITQQADAGKSYALTGGARRGRTVRELVLDALADLGWPSYTREIAQYCHARFGQSIPATRFGTLVSDEMAAYQRAQKQGATPRPAWICFVLTHDRHEPIKRLLARSDWPIESRILAPTTGRVQHLRVTARLCEIALTAEDTADDPEMLKIIAADHARDVSGITFRRGKFDLELWRNTALKMLADLEPVDEETRRECADRLRRRSEVRQLFGMTPGFEVVEPLSDAKGSGR